MITGNFCEKTRREKIIVGCDHRGRNIFDLITDYLHKLDRYDLVYANDVDDRCIDYPDIASEVARSVGSGQADWGILICGTGIGMCVVANKFPGVRAAPCHNEVAAELSRKHNDSNILCLSGDMLGERSSLLILEKWLETLFIGGRHQNRLDKIRSLEGRILSDTKLAAS